MGDEGKLEKTTTDFLGVLVKLDRRLTQGDLCIVGTNCNYQLCVVVRLVDCKIEAL
jgi:hypothetical protein